MFRPGSIRKIEVKNFVTYSYVELYPGPKLNMIIGPNGTGKSTMVAAIILGLGGNPKIVGRGSRISEYVKHDCELSAISLYLQDEHDNKFVKVTREFDTRDRTTWKLNNRTAKLDDVLECIKKFNIQVNNLCQFLPQDRVQDFAKLNKQDLLRETQKALCRFDLIEKQDFLINSREQHKQLSEIISDCQKKIQEYSDLNSRLEGRVQSFNKKKKYGEKIQGIERKIAWSVYEGKRSQLTDIKKNRIKAQEMYDKHKTEIKPVENEISETKTKITELQQQNNNAAWIIRNFESSIKTNLEKINSINDSIMKLDDEMETKLAEIDQWDKEIENAVNKLEEMRVTQQEANTLWQESEHSKQLLTSEMTKLTKSYQVLQDKTEELLQIKQDEMIRIRALESESSRLENVKQTRLQHLKKLNPDAFNAVTWVRNNKHLFQGEVYEPIMLELNVLENKHSKYIENIIPLRDRIAFTCTHKGDMNKLIKSLREDQKLSVNVVHANDSDQFSPFRPALAIETLRKYGFYAYMNNLVTAPVPIMNYLCKTYHLHNIPLGDQTTDNHYEEVPRQIRQFFSATYRYSVIISKYTGLKTVRQVEVGSDGSLSFSLDVVKMNQFKGQIVDIQRRISGCESQKQVVDKQMNALSEKIIEMRFKLKEIQQQKMNAQSINTRAQTLQKKIDEMKQIKANPEQIRNENKRKKLQLLKSIPEIHPLIKKDISKLIEQEKNNMLTVRKIEEVRKNLAYLENMSNEKRRQCQEAEEILNKVKENYTEVIEEAKSLLAKAKGLSKGFTPADSGFQQFREEYDSLLSDVEELNLLREQLQSRIACLNVADDGEMREYEHRVEEIQKLTNDLEKHELNLTKITTKMRKLEEEWLIPLNILLAEINLNFASAFEKLCCAGEVSLFIGDNDKNFSQYGISIKVTYRSGEPLQELNSNVQSGGERAVATAAYMLSLQKLTPVPFRCVDEINQGMDANNERRIFELVVDSTCQGDSSQYFLITPKLISHLKYSPNMLIHIVHNGPFVGKDKKWGFSKLCNHQTLQIA